MTFASLGLAPYLLRAIEARGYESPTSIQMAAIPSILRSQDVWACSQTGSGKTAAFSLPLIQLAQQRARERSAIDVLVLVPTRELAGQIRAAIGDYARYAPQALKVLAVFGGVSINPQMMALRGGADVVVATPGRLLDLVRQNALSLAGVTALVLDEADRLLDLGFAGDIDDILQQLPERRQNLLFSATFPSAVQGLANRLLRDPLRIDVPATPSDDPDILQRVIEVDASRRTPLLRHLIQAEGWTRLLVFVATKYATEHVADKLRRAGIAAAPLHGDLSQGARTHALAEFKESRLQVIVATDLASRGIDIAALPAVVNYDLPRSAADYIHRIGRTGRAGMRGTAVSFVDAQTEAHFRLIEKRHRLRLPREQIAGFAPKEVAPERPAPGDPTGGIKGRRKSKKDKLREAAARNAGSGTPGSGHS